MLLPRNPNAFTRSPLDRAGHRRKDEAWIKATVENDQSLLLAFNKGRLDFWNYPTNGLWWSLIAGVVGAVGADPLPPHAVSGRSNNTGVNRRNDMVITTLRVGRAAPAVWVRARTDHCERRSPGPPRSR